MLPVDIESTEVNETSVISVFDIPRDKVKFENIMRKYVSNPQNPSIIMIEYVLDKNVQSSTRDWIGLFPRGWNDLLQNVLFEYCIAHPYNEHERRWRMNINLKFANQDLYHPEFQFVFVNSNLQVLGTSTFFRFYKNKADADKAQKFSNMCVRSEVQKFETGRSNNKSIRLAEGFDGGHKMNGAHPPIISSNSDGLLHLYRNDGYRTNCSNCKRVPELFTTNMRLLQNVKNLAEENRDLKDHIKDLEKKLELSLAAQRKLRLVADLKKEEKIAFQSITNTFMPQFLNHSNLNVTDGNFEPLYRQIFHVCTSAMLNARQMYTPPSHQMMPGFWPLADIKVVVQPPPLFPCNRSQRRSRSVSSMLTRQLEMKAIIGAQDERLRLLSSKIAQMEAPQKDATSIPKLDAVKVTTFDVTDSSLDLNNN